MIILIGVFLYLAIAFQREYDTCRSNESPYCLSITCPCDVNSPCNGSAFKTDDFKTFYCQNNPKVAVDSNGKPIDS